MNVSLYLDLEIKIFLNFLFYNSQYFIIHNRKEGTVPTSDHVMNLFLNKNYLIISSLELLKTMKIKKVYAIKHIGQDSIHIKEELLSM